MNELGNSPADKNYKPSGISKAESRALEFYPMKDFNKEPNYLHTCDSKMLDEIYRQVFMIGYEQAEKDISALIESRISGIIGDAQPKPALRAELQELIKRIKEEQKND